MPSSSTSGNTPHGWFPALKAWSALLLESGKTRLALLANELAEERQRLIRFLLLTQAALFCVAFAIILGISWLVLAFWEQRLLILGLAFAFFTLLAWAFYSATKAPQLAQKPLFSTSLSELEEDIRQLKTTLKNEPPAE